MVFEVNYEAELRAEVVFRSIDGDPNLVQSEGYIPGSSIWGGLANYLVRSGKLNYTDSKFQDWFLESQLRFLNGYPYQSPWGDNEKERLLPLPLSFRSAKNDEEQVFDLAKSQPSEQTTKVRARFIYLGNGEIQPGLELSHFNYHTERDRLAGRATDEAGNVFVYEALQPGQFFAGKILGEKEVLEELVKLSGNEPVLQLGRSRGVQYGGNVILRLGKVQKFKGEVESRQDFDAPYQQLIITLLSPLLLNSQQGYSSLEFPIEQLAKLLDGSNPPKLSLKNSYIRTVIIGGYSSAWQLPRQQWTALAAGSVFVIGADEPISIENFKLIEAHSLGLRVEEGFGRFVINWHGKQSDLKLKKANKPVLVQPERAPESLVILMNSMIKTQWTRQVELAALRLARGVGNNQQALSVVKPALLNRLHSSFQAITPSTVDSLENAKSNLLELRPIARQQLERLILSVTKTKKMSLFDHFIQVLGLSKLNDPLFMLVTDNIELLNEKLSKLGWEIEGEQYEEWRVELIRHYLITLLEQLSRQRRTIEN